jgi:type II secretory pathway predicted ATPase ExeA
MYATHFGLRERPFRAVPDSEAYYPATGHERALAQLLQAIRDDEGLVLLTGEPGTGKTTLGHCLLDRLGDEAASAFLTNSHFEDRSGLLQAILYDLGLPYEGHTPQEMRLALTEFAIKNYGERRRTLVVLDEAQNLTPDLMEELRLLTNLEGAGGKAVQVLLLAQPAILETLRLPALAAFEQRLGVRARLESLGLHEAADYLVHHLRAKGGQAEAIVSDEALELLARATRGVPRLLNRAAHQALALAASAEADQVDAEVALETLALLGLAEEEKAEEEILAAVKAEEVPAGGDRAVLVLDPDAKESDSPPPSPPRDPSRARRLFASPRRPA